MNADEGKITLDWTNRIWNISNYDNILYVGMHPKTFNKWGGDYFLDRIKIQVPKASCTVVEIEKDFVDELSVHPIALVNNIKFVNSSIQEYLATTKNKHSCIIWWHGPEHLPKEDSLRVIQDFEKVCNPSGAVIILGCPLGHQPYEDGNDRHHWDVYEVDFENLGYNTMQ